MASKLDLINALPRFYEVSEEFIAALYLHPGDGMSRHTVELWVGAVNDFIANGIELPELIMRVHGFMTTFLADPLKFGNVKLVLADEYILHPDPKATVVAHDPNFPDLRELIRRARGRGH